MAWKDPNYARSYGAAWARQRRAKDPEARNAYLRAWRAANPEKVAHAAAVNRENNRANWKASSKRYCEANRTRRCAIQVKRVADQLQRTPAWADVNAINSFYVACQDGFEVDHVIPMRGKTVSGLHVIANLQYLTKAQNRLKGNRYGEG